MTCMKLGDLGRKTFAAPLAAFALVAGGGVALAASGGSHPAPGGGPAPEAAAHQPADVGSPTPEPTDSPSVEPTDEPAAAASPTPSLTGLCHAYKAGGYASSTKHGHVNPAWSALEAAAGGAANVGPFCDARLAAAAAAKPADGDDAVEPEHVKPAKAAKPARSDHDEQGDDDATDGDDQGDDEQGEDAGDHGGHGGDHGSEHGDD